MRRNIRIPMLAILAALLGALALTSAVASTSPDHKHPGSPVATASPVPRTLSERNFLELMIPHHDMAVEMARIAQRRSKNVYVKDVALDVLTQQPWEIRLMEGWRQKWYGVAKDARRTLTHAEMDRYGMSHNMDALAKAKPFPAAFFRAMIPHHQGGITMAREVLRTNPRPETARLAKSIIVAQQADIDRMKRFLRGDGWAPPAAPDGKPPVTP
jgi:uncharacterized protein (DUF305 family)